jgi:hypothetical protein
MKPNEQEKITKYAIIALGVLLMMGFAFAPFIHVFETLSLEELRILTYAFFAFGAPIIFHFLLSGLFKRLLKDSSKAQKQKTFLIAMKYSLLIVCYLVFCFPFLVLLFLHGLDSIGFCLFCGL